MELREEVAELIVNGGKSAWQTAGQILAIPRIAEALKLLDEQERK